MNAKALHQLKEATALARSAAKILDRDGNERIGSATWRLADALDILREARGDLPGIHSPTDRGAMLAPKVNRATRPTGWGRSVARVAGSGVVAPKAGTRRNALQEVTRA